MVAEEVQGSTQCLLHSSLCGGDADITSGAEAVILLGKVDSFAGGELGLQSLVPGTILPVLIRITLNIQKVN